MSTPSVESPRGSAYSAFSLAHLLEQIERSPAPIHPDQYRLVVARLSAALQEPLPDVALIALLRTYPAAAELYENLHYELSGLSRSSLERNVSSEVLTTQCLARLAASFRSST